MMLFCRNFFVSKFVKIISILFLLLARNWNYQTICVHVYTLHSDEVVSLLISGYDIVVYGCSPMAARYIQSVVIKLDLYWH